MESRPDTASAEPFDWPATLTATLAEDPYARTEDIIKSCPPLFRGPSLNPRMIGGRVWIATRFETIREIFQNNDHYSHATSYPYFRMIGEDLLAIPLQIDPPEHGKYRKLLEPAFSPRAVMAMGPRIRATVHKLIDGFVDAGECDVAYDFGRVYPVRVFMELMGFREERFEDFLSWSHPMHFEIDNPERMMWGTRNALEYIRSFVAQVRAAPPDDTVASLIAHGKVEGRPLTENEIVGTIFFLWDGGLDTVAATSSLLFRRLAMNPGLQELLRGNLDRMANAVEEFLRMNPTVNTARTAKVDHELEGEQILAGDTLMCIIASGNFDPDKFETPREFRLDRTQNRHLTFVAGAHRCLGINLARFELGIATSEFLRRIPTFRLRPGVACEATPGLIGAPRVPIVWEV